MSWGHKQVAIAVIYRDGYNVRLKPPVYNSCTNPHGVGYWVYLQVTRPGA